jgi:hypothetical protein
MTRRRVLWLLCVLAAVLAGVAALAANAGAQPLEDDGGTEWRLERILPAQLPTGQTSNTPIGLGKIGDIEFFAPNKGLLITAGDPPTVPAGLWAYSGDGSGGNSWHELSTVCGATDGRIAWAGPDEFWTISDGRTGQAANGVGQLPPLEDNTLCHFSGGRVVGSYAKLAFQSDSYLPMQAAACIDPSDCWFGGDALEAPQIGGFHLHWNGSSVEAEPSPEGHAAEAMALFEGRLYESVLLQDVEAGEPAQHPYVVHEISPEGVQPTFVALTPESPSGQLLPQYASGAFPEALGFMHLSADEEGLWAAAAPVFESELPKGSQPGEVTVMHCATACDSGGTWSQLIGPGANPPAGDPFAGDVVRAIAAEPGSEGAWIALDSERDAKSPSPTASALVARISADGKVSDELSLPSAQEISEGVSPKGAATQITCPAAHDCWLVTTQGWLFHLSNGSSEGEGSDSAFSKLITERPPDEGVPQVVPDAPPSEGTGLPGEAPSAAPRLLEATASEIEAKVTLPLLSDIRSRLVHGTTLELSFHLAVKARVRLVAKRHAAVVASTPTRTMAAGSRDLQLRLNRRRWPTKLALQTHALAPLPTASTRNPGVNTVTTGMFVLPSAPSFAGSDSLP